MADKLIALSSGAYTNWTSCPDAPPVVLNPKASLHACLAWCWGEIVEANQLAMQGQAAADGDSWDVLGNAIQSRLMIVEAMLHELCKRTLSCSASAATDAAGRA